MDSYNKENFEKHLYELTPDNITQLTENEKGGELSAVLRGLEVEAFTLLVNEIEENKIDYQLVYINGEKNLTGFALINSVFRKERNEHTMMFARFIADRFKSGKSNSNSFLNMFNTYQHLLRTALEKFGYFTYSTLPDNMKGEHLTMMAPGSKGIIYVPQYSLEEIISTIFELDRSILENKTEVNKVYLILNKRNNYIKIGRSKNPKTREKTLQSEEPTLKMIAVWEAENIVEKHLHQKYKSKRIRGEWFDLSLKDLVEISEYMTNNKLHAT